VCSQKNILVTFKTYFWVRHLSTVLKEICLEHEETPRRKITVTSSLYKIFTDQVGKQGGGEGWRLYSACPFL
jgi:hypothetical protein